MSGCINFEREGGCQGINEIICPQAKKQGLDRICQLTGKKLKEGEHFSPFLLDRSVIIRRVSPKEQIY